MEIKTNAGKTYTVVSASGCTVSTTDGTAIKELEAGQDYFTAISGKTVISDDAAVVQEVFKLAPYQKLTLLGVVGGDKLPAGYIRCDFLESTGSQYIDTGIRLNSESDVWMRACATQAAGGYLFGSMDVVERRVLVALGNTNLQLSVFSGYGNSYRYTYGINTLETHEYRFNGRTLTVDRGTAVNYGVVPYFESTTPCYLFAFNRLAVGVDGRGRTRILWAKIAGLAHFIPALDSAGTPCMYDTVTRQPFYNQGTGAFVVGLTAAQARRLANLPSGSGALTVSLPQSIVDADGNVTDAAVNTALNTAADNGWDIIIQYYS